MKRNKIRLFTLALAISAVLLCAHNLWAQQPSPENSSQRFPQVEPPTPPAEANTFPTPPPPPPAAAEDASTTPASPSDASSVPEWVIYRFYFMHVGHVEQAADEQEKKHKESEAAAWRTHEQHAVDLSDDEAKTLKEVALDCNRALKDQDQKMEAFRNNYHSQHPGDVQPPPEYTQLWDERIQIISNHIDQLKQWLSDSSFQKLNSYVKREFAPSITKVATPTATPEGMKQSTRGGAR